MEEKYIEIAIRIKHSDWRKLDNENFHKKIWKKNRIVKLCIDCEVLAFGVDGFINKKLEEE